MRIRSHSYISTGMLKVRHVEIRSPNFGFNQDLLLYMKCAGKTKSRINVIQCAMQFRVRFEISQNDIPTKSLDFRTTPDEAWASLGKSRAIRASAEVFVARDFKFRFMGRLLWGCGGLLQ